MDPSCVVCNAYDIVVCLRRSGIYLEYRHVHNKALQCYYSPWPFLHMPKNSYTSMFAAGNGIMLHSVTSLYDDETARDHATPIVIIVVVVCSTSGAACVLLVYSTSTTTGSAFPPQRIYVTTST